MTDGGLMSVMWDEDGCIAWLEDELCDGGDIQLLVINHPMGPGVMLTKPNSTHACKMYIDRRRLRDVAAFLEATAMRDNDGHGHNPNDQ